MCVLSFVYSLLNSNWIQIACLGHQSCPSRRGTHLCMYMYSIQSRLDCQVCTAVEIWMISKRMPHRATPAGVAWQWSLHQASFIELYSSLVPVLQRLVTEVRLDSICWKSQECRVFGLCLQSTQSGDLFSQQSGFVSYWNAGADLPKRRCSSSTTQLATWFAQPFAGLPDCRIWCMRKDERVSAGVRASDSQL